MSCLLDQLQVEPIIGFEGVFKQLTPLVVGHPRQLCWIGVEKSKLVVPKRRFIPACLFCGTFPGVVHMYLVHFHIVYCASLFVFYN